MGIWEEVALSQHPGHSVEPWDFLLTCSRCWLGDGLQAWEPGSAGSCESSARPSESSAVSPDSEAHPTGVLGWHEVCGMLLGHGSMEY